MGADYCPQAFYQAEWPRSVPLWSGGMAGYRSASTQKRSPALAKCFDGRKSYNTRQASQTETFRCL